MKHNPKNPVKNVVQLTPPVRLHDWLTLEQKDICTRCGLNKDTAPAECPFEGM